MISDKISPMKRGNDIWHEFMKNYEFWCTKKCPGKEFIYEFMKNHEFIYEFMKKTYDLGCTKKCPVKEFLYMNSYINMAIRVVQIRATLTM